MFLMDYIFMIMIQANALFNACKWKYLNSIFYKSHFNVLQKNVMTVTMIYLNKYQLNAAQQILWWYMIIYNV